MPLGQTITVVNKSGKIVSSSKQLVNVWKEARAAYRERKAEIEAYREAEFERKRAERRAQKQLEGDAASRASSHRSKPAHRSKSTRRGERPSAVRGYTDTYYGNDPQPQRHGVPRSAIEEEALPIRNKELTRRHTDGNYLAVAPPGRRYSEPHNSWSRRSSIDMDLAYGDLPPPVPQTRYHDDEELRGKMTTLTKLLDEANCLQYSVTTMVEHLQKNPDALAAVALTLAEISNLAAKMAPGALGALKSAFPAATALLMSPQFLIAAGLGVGVTVVMLGGYKIIKRIKETKEERELEAPMELHELEDVDLSRIEMWRRGIADVAAESAGSTVDGEFITPDARTRLAEEGVLRADDVKSTRSHKTHKSKSGHRHKASSKAGTSTGRTKDKDGKKKKAPSALRMLFSPDRRV
ncbi:uncharacterized protein PV09_04693 [Verruconis gallopava]|uniref:Uncharacterized protein n=1 Tax=Verruconis gallopava TaxID=253628 RepID=A0A0D1XPD3_9PEZI|nr:uncharacterized protein PV09_04693 [Verruconis gallopava]KIW04421.1 hypothetical protein PV09_04693 [Verruconis gallopava]